ncbi:MAG: DUF192 domain-containing protein [Acidobacteria bacterium]|uniref:DUF192 domain-containing protein n=1 Tax=Candidatus Polarisedimenticola svalbardensis TaxID=2886004 RepID=A0A8J6Y069_9BACT|nr:DUF192 domain-containing protein [Candidatus Polarisedimenticola svalbardensis]
MFATMLFFLQLMMTADGPKSAVAVLPSGDEFMLELAVTPEERRIGYMHRDQVGPGDGMLFLFGTDEIHGIWMKNCRVALDIIWLDRDFKVVHIATDRQPCEADGPCPSAYPFRPARYVLELAAGRVGETGLKAGDQVVVLSDPPIR